MWKSIGSSTIAFVPYFRDLVFPGSICRTCGACGMYYRQLTVTDAEKLKNLKNIIWSQSFIVTWHNARKFLQTYVSDLLRHFLTNFNKGDLKA